MTISPLDPVAPARVGRTTSTRNRTARDAIRQMLDAAYLTLHVAPMGFTLSLPLLGVAVSGVVPTGLSLSALLLVGFAFHVFAYGLNDVVDLPLDRSEPQRQDDPLVRGLVAPRTLLAVALLQLPVALWVAWSRGIATSGLMALMAAFIGLGAYDVWGKRCRWPWLTDLVQAVGWAALAYVGVRPHADSVARVFCLLGALVLYIMLINGVHGPVRDLTNDARRGARTTAILLGARPVDDGCHLPRALVLYAVVLHAGLLALLAPLLAGASRAWWTVAVGLAAVCSALLVTGYRQRAHARSIALAGAVYVALSFALIVVAGGHSAPWTVQRVLLALIVLPSACMFVRNRRAWT